MRCAAATADRSERCCRMPLIIAIGARFLFIFEI